MRIRTIKPEFWTDSTMVQLDPMARLLFIGLWNVADDHGYLADEPERLAMLVLPREPAESVEQLLDLLVAADRIERFQDGEYSYLRVKNWERHQRVDKPSVSRIAREGLRKATIPAAVRRSVAEKYGCKPGKEAEATCYYCGSAGHIHWWKLASGAPSAWVSFSGLELEHFESESTGGETTSENFVLACRHCNRSKGAKHQLPKDIQESSRALANPREPSPLEGKGSGSGSGSGEMSSKPDLSNVAQVFDYWRQKVAPRARVDTKRERLIQARLGEGFTVADLKSCVDGYTRSPFHQGQNDRHKKFLGLELMFRDAAHVEQGLELAGEKKQTTRAVKSGEDLYAVS